MRVAVLGNGYVGTVTAACLAWLGNQVVGYEADAVKAGQLDSGQLPFYEPGLSELLNETLATGLLRFTSLPEIALYAADLAFLCVGTPPGDDGLPDLTQMRAAVDAVSANLSDGLVIATKSTVPVGTSEWIRSRLRDTVGNGRPFFVGYNPEFLREGSAITDFLHPDRLVLGGDGQAIERMLAVYEPILRQSFSAGDGALEPELFVTDLASAEMAKYASNAFLATKISFSNEMADLCELVGADARQVLPAVGADRRIGPSFLEPGLGWGGSCLPKDLSALHALAARRGLHAPLLRGAREVNDARVGSVVAKLRRGLGELREKRIAVLGLTFKPGTDDLRDAPALKLIPELLSAGAVVSAHDPMVKRPPGGLVNVGVAADPYEAARDADALVVATGWPQFRDLDLELLRTVMKGSLVVDARNLLNADALRQVGMTVVGVGWA